MSVNLAGALFMNSKTAFGWVVLVIVLTQNSDQTNSSVALFSLMLAELLGHLLTSGISAQQHSAKSAIDWENTMGRTMLRWVVLLVFVLAIVSLDLLVFYKYYPFAVVCTLGASLILATLKTVALFQTGTRKWINAMLHMRQILIALAILLMNHLTPMNADLALAVSVVVLLCLLASFLWKFPTFGIEVPKEALTLKSPGQSLVVAAPLALRYADLMVLPMMLTPANAFVYLMVRGFAQSIGLVLDVINTALFDPLMSAFQQGKYSTFVSVVARANLGILLIGGGACLVVLSTSPYILAVFEINTVEAHKALLFVVVAESAPVFFGATTILMRIVRKQRETTLIAGAGVLMICVLAIFTDISDMIELAVLFACVQLACTASAAALLGWRFGIWPGLTAILFRQIKLF